jgi:hypothetical protein
MPQVDVWLMDCMLAPLLCHYGRIYPIDTTDRLVAQSSQTAYMYCMLIQKS